MTLRKRLEKLEAREPLEPELASGLTDYEAYMAIIDRRDLTFEKDPEKPGSYRLIKRPPIETGPSNEELLGRPLTPQEAYDAMTGKLDIKALAAKR